MCIIAIKPKNKDLQDKETLKTCFTRNPDGSGYMFVHDNVVEIKKGYMTFDEFYKDLINDYNKYNLKNQNLVMHFRIGTSGQSKLGCTHPFAITILVNYNRRSFRYDINNIISNARPISHI